MPDVTASRGHELRAPIGSQLLVTATAPLALGVGFRAQEPAFAARSRRLCRCLRRRPRPHTGGTRGIGAAITRAYLDEGAEVGISGTTERSLAAALEQLPGPEGFMADLAEENAPDRLVDAVLSRFGRLDIVVNNAGVISRADEWELTPKEWDRVHVVVLSPAGLLAALGLDFSSQAASINDPPARRTT
jgi:hypothetical protein